MPRFVNDLHGIVWAIREDGMEILLPRGGTIMAPKTGGVRVGQSVAFLMDAADRHVIQVMPKEEADEAVKRGSDHLFDAVARPPEEEDNDYGEEFREDGSVFWCPELA